MIDIYDDYDDYDIYDIYDIYDDYDIYYDIYDIIDIYDIYGKYDIYGIYDIYDIYDSACLLLVSFCRSVPPEFLRSFLMLLLLEIDSVSGAVIPGLTMILTIVPTMILATSVDKDGKGK